MGSAGLVISAVYLAAQVRLLVRGDDDAGGKIAAVVPSAVLVLFSRVMRLTS